MPRKPLPTPEELRQLLRYEPETGRLYWLPRPSEMFKTERDTNAWNTRYAGREAFLSPHSDGYRQGRIHERKYLAHRVAYAIHHGEWPPEDIDHINGVCDDNRIENLRAVSRTVNNRNRNMQTNNKSGVNGVNWHKTAKKWMARIYLGGMQKSLGYFDSLDDAVAARKAAEVGHGYTERHGTAA